MNEDYVARILKSLTDLEKPIYKDLGSFDLCKYFHKTAAEIPLTDAFHIGLWDDEIQQIGFPYSIDQEVWEVSDYHPLLDSGPSSWVIKERKSFVLTPENKHLHRSGARFGNRSRMSKSAIHSPMIATNSEQKDVLVGVISIQSYTANAYDEKIVDIFEILAATAGRHFLPFVEKETLRELRERIAEQATLFNQCLQEIMQELDALRQLNVLASNDESLSQIRHRISLCSEHCRETQARMLSKGIRISLLQNKRRIEFLDKLTSTERKIGEKLLEGKANGRIAQELKMTPESVRTHIKNACSKLGVDTGRNGLYDLLHG